MSKLDIIFVDSKKAPQPPPPPPCRPGERSKERYAKFERLWLDHANELNPLNSAQGRQRIQRTLDLINKLTFTKAIDLGCGSGPFLSKLLNKGALVDALDISRNALKNLENQSDTPSCNIIQDALPMTGLEDNNYDLVISTDVIADLPSNEHRLYFSELSRLLTLDGSVICSSALDVMSVDALHRFMKLVETEFCILELQFSHHRLYQHIQNLLKMPSKYVEAWNKPSIRHRESEERKGLAKSLFLRMTRRPYVHIWRALSQLTSPLAKAIEQSDRTLGILEKASRWLFREKGISHVIVLGRRRKIGE
ncbi:hypothetical protein SCG7109_AG_00260 [Chlamydiales bacterium SCGC AG-110-M15]|nr:hypothetical protein SCG7109_AG_00260 [Chlamydiales bacterium SCGC AG-110-M15]